MNTPINDFKSDYYNLTDNAAEDIDLGYASAKAAAEVATLSAEAVARLAAMAVRYYDSPYTDRRRDLERGIASVLRREVVEDIPEEDEDE